MIYAILIGAGVLLLTFALGLLGNIPATPEWLLSMNTVATDVIVKVSYLFAWLLTPEIFFGSLVIVAAILVFEPIYYTIFWVLEKVPVLGIKK